MKFRHNGFSLTTILTTISLCNGAAVEEAPLKAHRAEVFEAVSHKHQPQVYGIATYDALFKYVLSDDKIRPSFFKAFVPDLPILRSERLDDHMNPMQKLQLLRTFLHSDTTTETVKRLSSDLSIKVSKEQKPKGKKSPAKVEIDSEATAFLHDLLGRFEEIKASFPEPRYNGTMDFVCELENGDYAMVEMQVIPQDYWDRRALAYVASFYGNQLTRGEHFKHIRKVIGINILGGGKNNVAHWTDTPTQFMRHYKMQEQLHAPARYIDGIELLQYSIMNAPRSAADPTHQEQSDWITFFKEGHTMSEEDVKKRIKTPSVLDAFNRAKIKDLPAKVLANYESEDKEYDRYSQFTADQIQKGKAEGEKVAKVEIARGMLQDNLPISTIAKYTGLTEGEIKVIK